MTGGVGIRRDRATVSGYGLIATWAFFLYFLGPVSPLLAESLGIPLSLAGLTGTALALGVVTAGFASPRYVAAVGRWWAGATALLLVAAGASGLAASPVYPIALVVTFLAALGGGGLANVATAMLADRQGPAAPRAITEANAVAAWVGLTSPALIGAVVGLGWGWRPAAVAVAAVALLMLTFFTSVDRGAFNAKPRSARGGSPPPTGEPPTDHAEEPAGALPRAFYWSLVAILVAVATEISLNFWGAVLLAQRTGVDLATTTATVSALVGGIAVGRTVGSRFTTRYRSRSLVYASLVVAALGFTIAMVSGILAISVLGLFVNGMGFALLYPLTQSLAIRHAGGRSDLAMGIMSVVIGLAMGLAPFALGALAGAVGVVNAFLIVPALLILGAIAVTRAEA